MPKLFKILTLCVVLIASFAVAQKVNAATEFVSIIDPDSGAGTDYSSLNLWEAAVQANLTATSTKVFAYGTASGTVPDNVTVQGQTSGATATLVHQTASTTSSQIMLKSISGTFQSGEQVYRQSTGASSTYIFLTNAGDSAIAVASCRSTNGTADTAQLTINGWTTASTTYIKIWTDPSTGARHNGKWEEGKYHLMTGAAAPIDIFENFLRIDGIQINIDDSGGGGYGIINGYGNTGATTDIRISNNIIKSDGTATNWRIGIMMDMQTSATAVAMAWNNLVYDLGKHSSSEGIDGSNGTFYVYNNTVKNSRVGIWAGGTFYAKNNIVQDVTNGYSGTFDSSSNYNISSLGGDTTGGAQDKASTTVSFVDLTNKDFHLSPIDTAARDAGTSSPLWDANLSFHDDINGTARGGAWDIGADEVSTEFISTIAESGGDYTSLDAWQDNVADLYLVNDDHRVFSGTSTGSLTDAAAVTLYRSGASTGLTGYIQATTTSQIFVHNIAGTTTPLTAQSGDQWRIDASNYWTVSGTGDQLGASPAVVAKITGSWTDAVTTTFAIGANNWTTSYDNYIKIYTDATARHNGKWDATKFRFDIATSFGIDNNENYVRIDGLQFDMRDSSSAGIENRWTDQAGGTDIRLSNNIIWGNSGTWSSGVFVGNNADYVRQIAIWNNIMYDWLGSSGQGIYISGTSAKAFIYNNTIYNSRIGIRRADTGEATVINNIVQNITTDGYNGTFATSSDYNISDIAGDAPNLTFATTSKTVVFKATTTDDFHLADSDTVAKGAGENLYNDANINVTNDIDSAARPATSTIGLSWDIGADQTAVKIYRSIAPGATTVLATGAIQLGSVTISATNSIASFIIDGVMPTNIGVGDAIIYNSNGVATATAFIHGRIDSMHYIVKTASGTLPTAVSADTSWSIYRAYTSLSNAEAGIENTGVPSAMRNFDDWTDGGTAATDDVGKDILSSNHQWNIAAYANGSTVDTVRVAIDGWTTGAQNFLKIYTPVSAFEVGTSQRHQGKWDDGKYSLEASGGGSGGTMGIYLEPTASYVHIQGLQIKGVSDGNPSIILDINTIGGSETQISDNILRGNFTSADTPYGIELRWTASTDNKTIKIWNNIVYDIVNGTTPQAIHSGGSFTAYIYNNTFYNCYRAIGRNAGTLIGKNNIVKNCTYGYDGNLDASSDYNISDISQADADSANITFDGYKSVSFVDATNKDFHLAPADTTALDAGVNPFFAQDYFDRANVNPISGNWTTSPGWGALKIVSNGVTATAVADSAAYWNANVFSPDQYSQVKMTASPYGGPAVRLATSGTNMYGYVMYGSDLYRIYDNGWSGVLDSISGSINNDDIVKLTASGVGATVTIKAYVNGELRLTYSDSTGSRVLSGSPGIYLSNTTDVADNWEGGNLESPFFVDDIDGQLRRQWDIGADEGSVEYVTSVMEAGGNFSTLSAWEAANQVDLATTTTAVFSLSSASGTIPANSSIMGLTSGAIASTTVGSVSTSTQILLYNLPSASSGQATFLAGETVYIKGAATTTNYAILANAGNPAIATAKIDGAWTGADATAVTINGWTTAPTNYIRVYTTPTARHNGKWDDSKYVLSSTVDNVINVSDDYTWIDGLQISQDDPNSGFRYGIFVSGAGTAGENKTSNNIIRRGVFYDAFSLGFYASDTELNYYVWNNIVYDFRFSSGNHNSRCIYMGFGQVGRVYNNTAINCNEGYMDNFADLIFINNIAQDNDDGFNEVDNIASNYNISDIAGDAPGANSKNGVTVTFVDAVNNDFHLAPTDTAAKDAGVDLSTSTTSPFSTDIDGQNRSPSASSGQAVGTAWDIGADEGATIMYRSVGNTSAALGTGDTLTIASTTATFSAAQPDNIGVGDVIQYGNPLTLAFITGRASSTVYSVVNATGTYPVATTSASASIYRAHNLLNDWQTQTTATVNQSIDSGLRSQVLVARDLMASNTAMFVSAYASSSPDTTAVAINTWTTGAGNYIKVYTPVSATEVGVSQRHSGKWNEEKYMLEIGTDSNGIGIFENHTRLEGVQANMAYTPTAGTRGIIYNNSTGSTISGSIVKATVSDNGARAIRGIYDDGSGTKVFNNLAYDINGTAGYTAGFYHNNATVSYFYNNTAYNTRSGFIVYGNANSVVAKNNITQNNGSANGYNEASGGSFHGSSDYNISDISSDAPNATFGGGYATVSFVDAANGDLHLAPTDAAARDSGVSLAADSYLPFTIDINDDTRPQGAVWDIGADEAVDVPDFQMKGKVKFKGNVKLVD